MRVARGVAGLGYRAGASLHASLRVLCSAPRSGDGRDADGARGGGVERPLVDGSNQSKHMVHINQSPLDLT